MNEKMIYFYGIDEWNRPCFKALEENVFFGDTDHLFDYGASEEEVQKYYKDLLDINKYLCYFGTHFGCEPMGTCPESMDIRLKWVSRDEATKFLKEKKKSADK